MHQDHPSSTGSLYWLNDGEFPTGPYSKEQLHSRRAAGGISDASLVCAVGGKEWIKVADALDSAPTSSPAGSDQPVAADHEQQCAMAQVSKSVTSSSESSHRWFAGFMKLAVPPLIFYWLLLKPWLDPAKPRIPHNPALRIEEQQALRAEFEGRFGDAAKHRERAQQERAYEQWKARKER